jgi:hypothetical protein
VPVYDQNYIAALMPFLDQAGVATSGVSIVVDGIEMKGTGVSASAIAEAHIKNDPYSVETNRPGKGRIEIITKPGTPQVHGTLNVTFRCSGARLETQEDGQGAGLLDGGRRVQHYQSNELLPRMSAMCSHRSSSNRRQRFQRGESSSPRVSNSKSGDGCALGAAVCEPVAGHCFARRGVSSLHGRESECFLSFDSFEIDCSVTIPGERYS